MGDDLPPGDDRASYEPPPRQNSRRQTLMAHSSTDSEPKLNPRHKLKRQRSAPFMRHGSDASGPKRSPSLLALDKKKHQTAKRRAMFEHAATTIQSAQRGHVARKHVKKRRHQHKHRKKKEEGTDALENETGSPAVVEAIPEASVQARLAARVRGLASWLGAGGRLYEESEKERKDEEAAFGQYNEDFVALESAFEEEAAVAEEPSITDHHRTSSTRPRMSLKSVGSIASLLSGRRRSRQQQHVRTDHHAPGMLSTSMAVRVLSGEHEHAHAHRQDRDGDGDARHAQEEEEEEPETLFSFFKRDTETGTGTGTVPEIDDDVKRDKPPAPSPRKSFSGIAPTVLESAVGVALNTLQNNSWLQHHVEDRIKARERAAMAREDVAAWKRREEEKQTAVDEDKWYIMDDSKTIRGPHSRLCIRALMRQGTLPASARFRPGDVGEAFEPASVWMDELGLTTDEVEEWAGSKGGGGKRGAKTAAHAYLFDHRVLRMIDAQQPGARRRHAASTLLPRLHAPTQRQERELERLQEQQEREQEETELSSSLPDWHQILRKAQRDFCQARITLAAYNEIRRNIKRKMKSNK